MCDWLFCISESRRRHDRSSRAKFCQFFFHLKQSITILATVFKKHNCKIMKRTRLLHKTLIFPNGILRVAKETDKGTWYEQSSLLTLEQPSTSFTSRELHLMAPTKLSFALNFFFLPAFRIEGSSVSHNCRIVSKGVICWQNFGSKKKNPLRLYASVATSDELMWSGWCEIRTLQRRLDWCGQQTSRDTLT